MVIEERGPSGQRFGIGIEEYIVGDWCESPDGSGQPVAVAIQLMMPAGGDDDFVPSFIMRLKTAEAVGEMIAALQKHQASVWPESRCPLQSIRDALSAYHAALDNREHGGIAASEFVRRCQDILAMPWVQGASLK